MKAARCAPTLCGGKPNDLAAGTASYRLNFLAARLDGTENPTKRPPIRRMSVYMFEIFHEHFHLPQNIVSQSVYELRAGVRMHVNAIPEHLEDSLGFGVEIVRE